MPLLVQPAAAPSWLTLPAGWNTVWKAALAASATTPAHVYMIGDSFSTGDLQCTDWMNLSWFGLVRANLTARYGNPYDFFPPSYSTEYSTVSQGIAFQGTPPWSAIATGSITWYQAGYGRTAFWSGVNTADATFTPPYVARYYDVISVNDTAGNFGISLDGGADTVVTSTADAAFGFRRTAIDGLTNAVHTIRLHNNAVSHSLMLAGVACYTDRTKGIGFAWNALAGQTLVSWTGVTNAEPTDLAKTLQGASGGVGTSFGFPAKPSLLLFQINSNDMAGLSGFGLAGYKRAMQRIFQAVRRGTPNCSIMVLIFAEPDSVNTDLTSGQDTNSDQYPIYMAAAQEVAQQFNAAVVNIHAKWGETPVGQGFMASTDNHPNNAGMADIANTIIPLVNG